MSRTLKKFLCLMLATLMVLTALQGCGAGTPEKPTKLSSAADINRWFGNGGSLSGKKTPGDYYFQLASDIQLSQLGVLSGGYNVTIDLAGHTLTNKESNATQAFSVTDGATLTLKGGTMDMAGADTNGGLLLVDGGHLILQDMVLTNRADTATGADRSGGVLYVTGADPEAPASLTILGNTVINGSTSGTRLSGGAVTMEGNSVCYMLDGTIQNGVAGMSGNVHLGGQAQFHMQGGTITGGLAKKTTGVTGDGGNINVTAQSAFLLYGGTISGGKAERTGGNLFVSNYGKSDKQGFYQLGGVVEGGYSTDKGGNLYAVDKVSAIYIYGGEIKGGEAVQGGNMYLEAAPLQMYGGTLTGIEEESLNTYGGNIYTTRGDIQLFGGTITGSRTTSSGGNVYVNNGTIRIYGGSITHGKTNTTDVSCGGANLFATGTSQVYMYGGRISDGICNANMEDATSGGPNVMIAKHTQMHMFGGTVADGFLKGTTCRTGCIYVYGQIVGDVCAFHMYGGTLENGELEANVMRGLAVGTYSKLNSDSGFGYARIFDGNIVFKGDENSPNRIYTMFGNYTSNLFIFEPDRYEGLYNGAITGPCRDKSHNTQVGTVDATCLTPGCLQYHCDTCGDWYKITAEATGHTLDQSVVEATELLPGYTEVHCSACEETWLTDVALSGN